jgi:hypothetical protein
VLCCALLCSAVLCCAVLCCAVLCCAVLCCAVLCCAVLCSEESTDQAQRQCAVCLSDYVEGDELRVLPCSGAHRFHKQYVSRCVADACDVTTCTSYIRRADAAVLRSP